MQALPDGPQQLPVAEQLELHPRYKQNPNARDQRSDRKRVRVRARMTERVAENTGDYQQYPAVPDLHEKPLKNRKTNGDRLGGAKEYPGLMEWRKHFS
jgi:hypothetical protein